MELRDITNQTKYIEKFNVTNDSLSKKALSRDIPGDHSLFINDYKLNKSNDNTMDCYFENKSIYEIINNNFDKELTLGRSQETPTDIEIFGEDIVKVQKKKTYKGIIKKVNNPKSTNNIYNIA